MHAKPLPHGRNRIKAYVNALTPAVLALAALLTATGCQVELSEDQHPFNTILAKIMPPSPSQRWEKLARRLKSPDADLRRQGVLMLEDKDFAAVENTPELLTVIATGDPNPHVRATAVAVLGRLDTPTVPDKLGEVLPKAAQDPAPNVRRTAIDVLTQKPLDQTAPILRKHLNDEDAAVRAAAAAALADYPDRRTTQSLINAINDDKFEVAYEIRHSLIKITAQDFDYDQLAWQDWLTQNPDRFAQSPSP